MSRDLCIVQEFLEGSHRSLIRTTAEETGFTPYFMDPGDLAGAAEVLQHCEVLYAHHPELLRAAPDTLRWYCCAYAGVDPYCHHPEWFRNPDCLLTNSNVYGVTISEHVIMVLLMLLRHMPDYEAVVQARGWENQYPIRSIRGSDFTVLGTGNIGGNVADRLRGMGAARITGLSRSGAPNRHFDRVLPIGELDSVLPESHVLIMALPGTAETAGILSRSRLALLPEDAYVINVGRGTAIDQAALTEALNSGKLAGAALDVMQPEPLPQDDPLWTARNLILTPHISGNLTLGYTRDENVRRFCDDLRRYAAGLPLLGLVDRQLGY